MIGQRKLLLLPPPKFYKLKYSQLLSFRLLPLVITFLITIENNAQAPIKKQINWHGSISVDGQYSSYTPVFQETPSSYLFLRSTQTLTVAQIPIQGHGLEVDHNSATSSPYLQLTRPKVGVVDYTDRSRGPISLEIYDEIVSLGPGNLGELS